MATSSRQLDLKGKNSRQVLRVGIANMGDVWDKNWSYGHGWHLHEQKAERKEGQKQKREESLLLAGRGRKGANWRNKSLSCGLQSHPSIPGLLLVLHRWHHIEAGASYRHCFSVRPKMPFLTFLTPSSSPFPRPMPSGLAFLFMVSPYTLEIKCLALLSNFNLVCLSSVSVLTLPLTTLSRANLRTFSGAACLSSGPCKWHSH